MEVRYRKKEIGCEIRYSELDLRAFEYIEEFEKSESGEENDTEDCSVVDING